MGRGVKGDLSPEGRGHLQEEPQEAVCAWAQQGWL